MNVQFTLVAEVSLRSRRNEYKSYPEKNHNILVHNKTESFKGKKVDLLKPVVVYGCTRTCKAGKRQREKEVETRRKRKIGKNWAKKGIEKEIETIFPAYRKYEPFDSNVLLKY